MCEREEGFDWGDVESVWTSFYNYINSEMNLNRIVNVMDLFYIHKKEEKFEFYFNQNFLK